MKMTLFTALPCLVGAMAFAGCSVQQRPGTAMASPGQLTEPESTDCCDDPCCEDCCLECCETTEAEAN